MKSRQTQDPLMSQDPPEKIYLVRVQRWNPVNSTLVLITVLASIITYSASIACNRSPENIIKCPFKNHLKTKHLIGDKLLKVRNSQVINLGYRLMQTNTQNATKLYENAKTKSKKKQHKKD